MKLQSILIPVLLLLPFFSINNATEIHTLEEAVQKNLVSYSFSGNGESPHYVRPLIAKLTNKSSKPIQVEIGSGLEFEAGDAGYQNLVVTNSRSIYLAPGKEEEVPLYAMCTEPADKAPRAESVYKLKPEKNTRLSNMARYIEEHKMHNPNGQQAVWCVSSGKDIASIGGFDTAEVRSLQRHVAKLTGRPLPPPPAPDDYEHNYYAAPREHVSYKGVMNFRFSESHSISIGLFNERDVLVRELYNNPAEPAGMRKVEYAFDNTVYTDPVYYVRLVKDGDILMNRKIELN